MPLYPAVVIGGPPDSGKSVLTGNLTQKATLGSVLFAAVHGLVALLAGAVTGRKGVATGAGWGVVLAGYLASILATLDDGLEWLRWVSPLSWATADSPITGAVPGAYLALAGAFVALVAATVVVFDRHDLT